MLVGSYSVGGRTGGGRIPQTGGGGASFSLALELFRTAPVVHPPADTSEEGHGPLDARERTCVGFQAGHRAPTCVHVPARIPQDPPGSRPGVGSPQAVWKSGQTGCTGAGERWPMSDVHFFFVILGSTARKTDNPGGKSRPQIRSQPLPWPIQGVRKPRPKRIVLPASNFRASRFRCVLVVRVSPPQNPR